jgi:hypothetical protein
MGARNRIIMLVIGIVPVVVACFAADPTPIQTTTAPCAPIQRGLGFLNGQYDAGVGLLREAPHAAPHTYWLTNDNALAAYAFGQLGNQAMEKTLTSSIQRYGSATNGLIEAVWGAPIPQPPYVDRKVMVTKLGEEQVWQESHTDGARMDDWRTYANLAFLEALSEQNRGYSEKAKTDFDLAMKQFDGTGFKDAAYAGRYETYKVALALYAGSKIRASLQSTGPKLLSVLLAQQSDDGGFVTHYVDRHTPTGDTNTETTALALLALNAYGCAPR